MNKTFNPFLMLVPEAILGPALTVLMMISGLLIIVGARRQGVALLVTAMKSLNERERHILTERRLREAPTTLEDLSQHYNISRERVRQIEVRAFEKLQKAIQIAAIEQKLIAAA